MDGSYATMPRMPYPPIEPYETGMLDVGDGHRLYWECCGNRDGKPALFLHGGPGAGCGRGARRFFDPLKYRAVLFDQRGCGRSRPLASEPDADLSTNTTPHLVADIERLREALGVERWTILGISWGTTLALAYAEAHPERVEAMVLALVTTTSAREVAWTTRDLGRLLPEEHERFIATIPEALRSHEPVDAYATMLFDADADVRERAAAAWCAWDCAQMAFGTDEKPSPLFDDPSFRLGFARLVTHFWRNGAFYEGDALIRGAERLTGIRGTLIHGRYDVGCPLDVPRAIAKRWPGSTLEILESGHGGDELPDAITATLDRLAQFV